MLADLSPFPQLPPPSHHQSNFPPLQDGDHQFSQPPMTMDPAAVDFRAFYPYTPNEVKHRKRTTSTQLKTLEAIFKRDTKPNAALRNELAATLNMTARGVQVWFQNRRAKEKTKAAKLVTHSGKSEHDSSPSPEVESRRNDSILQTTFQHDETIMTGHESSPGRISPPQLHVITDSDVSYQSSPLVTPDDVNGHFMRRGSLPGDGYPSSEDSPLYPPLTGHLDPFGRRRSVDASLHRLASNPYAQLAKAKNGALHGSRPLKSNRAASYHRPSYVTDLSQTSVPHAAMHTRHSSMDSRNYRFSPHGIPSPSPSPLSSAYQHSVRASSLSDNSLYAYSTRPLCEPIPGPLPSPGFSFGAATSLASPYSGDSDRDSPDPYNGYAFRNEYEKDEQIYQPYSRYGSIASLTTNDSSEFYPESEPLHMADAVRRDSCTSIAGMLSGLDVGFDQDKISSIPDAASAQYQSQPLALAHSAELSYGMAPQPEQMLNGSVLDLHSGYGLNSESPLVEGASEPFFSPPNSYPSANSGYSLSYPAGDVYAPDAQSLGLPEVYPTYSNDNSLSNGSDYTPYI